MHQDSALLTSRNATKDDHWAKVCRSKLASLKRDDPKKSKPSTPRRQHGHGKGAKKVHNIEASQADGDTDFDALTFNDIKVSYLQSSRDEAFVTASLKLTSRPGIHNPISSDTLTVYSVWHWLP